MRSLAAITGLALLCAACAADAEPEHAQHRAHQSAGVVRAAPAPMPPDADASGGPSDLGAPQPDPGATDGGLPDPGAPADVTPDPGAPADAATSAPDPGPSADTGGPPASELPARYPTGRTHSPITASVAAHLQAIASVDDALADDVFAKVGASGTISDAFLKCFGGSDIDYDGRDAELDPIRQHFLAGDADGDDPFSRATLAAKVGMSAIWAITGVGGQPSPLDQELAALAPAFAIVNYGANDMQLGLTYQSAMWGFGDNLLTLVDQLIDQGVVPLLTTIGPRTDVVEAGRFVATYNAVIRGVAQGRQVPLLDMHHDLAPLPAFGLSGDGLHLNSWQGRPCIFTPEALLKGYNTRNLITLEALGRLREVVVDGAPALNEDGAALLGDGSPEAPFVIDALPFSDLRSTSDSAYAELSIYSGCASDTDESGPEHLYRFVVAETVRVRAMVHDRDGVDVDLHLLDETASEAGCLARAHQIIEATLTPGTYHLAVDSWVDAGGAVHDGEYLLVLVACHPDDPSCD